MARRPRPKLVRLKPPVRESQMADTLLMLLDRVREGRVVAFSICLIIDNDDGTQSSIESAGADGNDQLELQLLGIMRGAEQGLFRRREERRG